MERVHPGLAQAVNPQAAAPIVNRRIRPPSVCRLPDERTGYYRRTGVPFTLDIFGLAGSATTDLGIGQVWEDFASQADVVLPMVYPSHYRRGSYGIAHPNAQPYATVKRALEDAIQRSRGMADPATIRPYLQSFSIFRVRYTAAEVREQIRASEDLGLSDWVLWNSSGNYPAAAFRRTAGGRPPVVASGMDRN